MQITSKGQVTSPQRIRRDPKLPLPDFYIGAHRAIGNLALLTRDARRYQNYFPKLDILAP